MNRINVNPWLSAAALIQNWRFLVRHLIEGNAYSKSNILRHENLFFYFLKQASLQIWYKILMSLSSCSYISTSLQQKKQRLSKILYEELVKKNLKLSDQFELNSIVYIEKKNCYIWQWNICLWSNFIVSYVLGSSQRPSLLR